MDEFDSLVVNAFLDNQLQLLPEKIALDEQEARQFLEDCMAVVCDSIEQVKEYFEEEGVDISGMTLEDIKEAQEVFAVGDGRYLIVEA